MWGYDLNLYSRGDGSIDVKGRGQSITDGTAYLPSEQPHSSIVEINKDYLMSLVRNLFPGRKNIQYRNT